MSFFSFINHMVNFLLPAFWMATLLTGIERMMFRHRARSLRWWTQWLLLFACMAAVLLGGLIIFQRDGKMLTYVALVVVAGIVQAILSSYGSRQE